MTHRTAKLDRKTNETAIRVAIDLDNKGRIEVRTGIGFFDHLLASFAFHARFDLELSCEGDLHIDDHHTVEDCGIVLGQALDVALADRSGIDRFGYAYAPLDEALSRAVIDFAGRSTCVVDLGLQRDKIGELSSESLRHFFRSLASSARCALHIDVLRGDNDHHRAESAMKAFALALRQAVARSNESAIRSTKGII